mmetsp:Transcript_111445/g.347374  ORF Transcript_111445/g.347374 Transcript_111445/m.347374 type:complete len:209 (-) Transcript_111445:192-818(-)
MPCSSGRWAAPAPPPPGPWPCRSLLCATCSGNVRTVASALATAPMTRASREEMSAVLRRAAFSMSYAKNWITGLDTSQSDEPSPRHSALGPSASHIRRTVPKAPEATWAWPCARPAAARPPSEGLAAEGLAAEGRIWACATTHARQRGSVRAMFSAPDMAEAASVSYGPTSPSGLSSSLARRSFNPSNRKKYRKFDVPTVCSIGTQPL